MPLEIDPAWEYYVGDPEIEEVIGRYGKLEPKDGRQENQGMRVRPIPKGRGLGQAKQLEFIRMYYSGEVGWYIAVVLGTTEETLKRWKKQLNLPNRSTTKDVRDAERAIG